MSKSLVIQEAWSQIDLSFDALRALIKHKSGGNAQAAFAAIKVAQKSFGEASTLHQDLSLAGSVQATDSALCSCSAARGWRSFFL